MSSCLIFYKAEMGIDQTLAPERIQIGLNKIFFKESEMSFKMFMIYDKGENLCQK